MKVCIISGGTLNYINYMIKLYESLRIYHTKVYFEFNIIYDKTCECKEYKKYLELIENYKQNDKFLLLKIHEKIFKNDNEKRSYSSNIRIKYLLENLNKYDMMFWMDADTLIKKPLTQLFEIDNKYKIICKKESNRKIEDNLYTYNICLRRQTKTGIIGFRNDESSKYLLENWYNIINNSGWEYVCWYEDQILLSYMMKKVILKYNISIFYNLPSSYIDWELDPNSYIWVGKGENKKDIYTAKKKKTKYCKKIENKNN